MSDYTAEQLAADLAELARLRAENEAKKAELARLRAENDAVHLWELKHPYYCSESNYFKNGVGLHFPSWAAFQAEMGGADDDYNLVFRWDWIKPDPTVYDTPEEVPTTDTLWVFYMQQRKGLYMPMDVQVTEADEPAVREWLNARWAHLQRLWAPL